MQKSEIQTAEEMFGIPTAYRFFSIMTFILWEPKTINPALNVSFRSHTSTDDGERCKGQSVIFQMSQRRRDCREQADTLKNFLP